MGIRLAHPRVRSGRLGQAAVGASGYEDTDASQWMPEMRAKEVHLLRQALALEEQAVAAMADAV